MSKKISEGKVYVDFILPSGELYSSLPLSKIEYEKIKRVVERGSVVIRGKQYKDVGDFCGFAVERLVEKELGKPLAPKAVCFVRDIPKTRNAKVMRRVIRSAYLGEEPGDLSALVNPEAVEEIRQAM